MVRVRVALFTAALSLLPLCAVAQDGRLYAGGLLLVSTQDSHRQGTAALAAGIVVRAAF